MDNKNWGVFGHIPEEHMNWFLAESGTKYSEALDKWKILKGNKANVFQDEMQSARKLITQEMSGLGEYSIGNKELFDLMRHGECKVGYEYQGGDHTKNIK